MSNTSPVPWPSSLGGLGFEPGSKSAELKSVPPGKRLNWRPSRPVKADAGARSGSP